MRVVSSARAAFADGKTVAVGIEGRKGRRNTPSLLNRAYGRAFFWDGHAQALEEQPLQAITNWNEMDLSLPEFEKRLNKLTIRSEQAHTPHPALSPRRGEDARGVGEGQRPKSYEERFQEVFAEKPTPQNAAKALATFVRTLLSGNSAFDRFEHGDQNALADAAK